jgi:hypothetical protein
MSSTVAGDRESSRNRGATARDNGFGGRGEETVKDASASTRRFPSRGFKSPSVGTSAALLEEEGRTTSDPAPSEMTISQMSRLFGVSLRTLRFYEDRGLIKPRREGNARFYRGADHVRMEMSSRAVAPLA